MDMNQQFRKLINFYDTHRRMPSSTEVARLFAFKSRNAAVRLIGKFIRQGMVAKDTTGKLLPTAYFTEVAVLGTVEAGFPSAAEEESGDTMSLDEFLIENREATYMLKVTGDSMIDAGLLPGDMVLVERRGEAKDGDIVIAEVDNGWTMKYLRKQGNKVYLEPANKKYKPIIPKQELKIAAIVVAAIRKY